MHLVWAWIMIESSPTRQFIYGNLQGNQYIVQNNRTLKASYNRSVVCRKLDHGESPNAPQIQLKLTPITEFAECRFPATKTISNQEFVVIWYPQWLHLCTFWRSDSSFVMSHLSRVERQHKMIHKYTKTFTRGGQQRSQPGLVNICLKPNVLCPPQTLFPQMLMWTYV